MKFLFLDIDGVLNTFAELGFKYCYEVDVDDGFRLDPAALFHLYQIVKFTKCKIVLSSTWRKNYSTLEEMRGLFHCDLLKNALIGKTPVIENAKRGIEIRSWLNTVSESVKGRYAILDDDEDFLTEQHDCFFHCDGKIGLTHDISNRVIRFLNSR